VAIGWDDVWRGHWHGGAVRRFRQPLHRRFLRGTWTWG